MVRAEELLDDLKVIGPGKIESPSMPGPEPFTQVLGHVRDLQNLPDRGRLQLGNVPEPEHPTTEDAPVSQTHELFEHFGLSRAGDLYDIRSLGFEIDWRAGEHERIHLRRKARRKHQREPAALA